MALPRPAGTIVAMVLVSWGIFAVVGGLLVALALSMRRPRAVACLVALACSVTVVSVVVTASLLGRRVEALAPGRLALAIAILAVVSTGVRVALHRPRPRPGRAAASGGRRSRPRARDNCSRVLDGTPISRRGVPRRAAP
jgi:hypothetical protein